MNGTYHAHIRNDTPIVVSPSTRSRNRCTIDIGKFSRAIYLYMADADLWRITAAIAAYWAQKTAHPVTAETTKDGGPLDGRD